MGKFKGCYLPYQLVRGPVHGTISRDGNSRKYQCDGYLEGTAVNTSSQLDNLVLNEVEPFDWSAARPFTYGYIAGHKVKLNDISEAQTEKRILAEAAQDFRPEVERVMQTSGVGIQLTSGSLMELSVLLPVYFIKSGKLTAVMNGQTGRIAVSKEREKKSYPWMIEPLLYTILATLLLSIPWHLQIEEIFLVAFVFAAIFFSIMGDGRKSLIHRITMQSENSKAKRENGELKIEEGKGILKNPCDNTPVFYEKNNQGRCVPVKIRFYSLRRWFSILTNTFVTVFLPAILAAFVRWVYMEPGEAFMDGYRMQYGAAWYVLAGMIAVMYLAKGVRRDVYEHPILYEILPNGKKRLIGRRKDRKVGILGMFGIGQTQSDGKKLTVFRLIKGLGGIGILLAAVTIVLLIGSTAAIIL